MRIEKERMHTELSALLREWCDALLRLQVRRPGQDALDGGVLCPACGMIHGRCVDAAYPLLCMAEFSGEEKYRTAAEKLFAWGGNVQCADGSMRNDLKSDWRGVTVFYAVALHDALYFHGRLLADPVREAWRARLREAGEWLYANLSVGAKAYINYYAANACAMALLGKMFARSEYLARAKELADYCLRHVSENGLLYGEGTPHDVRTPKGCSAVDIGYNVEETLPMLTRYAIAAADTTALDACRALWRAHLEWMTPDGAWDDSMGTRAFKWTYWGSRTSDGCLDALFALGRDEPVFAQGAWRNFGLLRACTHEGLLCGGPDNAQHGEPACVHHTFCHAKSLAAALDAGAYTFDPVPLPSDGPPALRRYPETDTVRISCGDWRAAITAYDLPPRRGTHAAGGTVSFLWHRACGAVIAAGMADFVLAEPHNQQLPRDAAGTRSACPRIETEGGSQLYDLAAAMTAAAQADGVTVDVRTTLCSKERRPAANGACALRYSLTAEGLCIEGRTEPAAEARYILPILSDAAQVDVRRGSLQSAPERIFCISPGFEGREFVVLPDADGRFAVRIHT